jgi:hypothetical protein
LRQKFEDDHNDYYFQQGNFEPFRRVDRYIGDARYSDLEKAFFLLLHQFPSDHRPYIIVPSEMVLVADVYDMSGPGIEYEIDFALYGGAIDNPVKVAIECDGMRSHRQKHQKKDRRKDVNLQAAGWIVIRFSTKDIHLELERFLQEEHYVSEFLFGISNTIQQKLRLIDDNSYRSDQYRSKLTGYKWGRIECPNCNKSINVRLNHIRVTCDRCQTRFFREVGPSENIKYEHNGIIFFLD